MGLDSPATKEWEEPAPSFEPIRIPEETPAVAPKFVPEPVEVPVGNP